MTKKDGFILVGKYDEFPRGKGICLEIDNNKYALFRSGNRIGAIANTCIHMDGPLSEGYLDDGYVRCPFHGWSYDLFTGKGPHRFKGEDVVSYEVRIINGDVWLSLEPRSEPDIQEEEKNHTHNYLEEWARGYDDFEPSFEILQHIIHDGKTDISSMGSIKKFTSWESILFKGGQLARMPLERDEQVNLRTIIGKTADKPLEINIPFYVSHMSFGALSPEAKIALSRGSEIMGTAMCSGEGGMLQESRSESSKYIYELGTARFSHQEHMIKNAEAIEIKIGQAAKPGLGGHLPGHKVTDKIAGVRGIEQGKDSVSPARHFGVNSIDDLIEHVDKIRDMIDGKPIGIKFSSGHVKNDITIALKAKPDFITIDTRGGGTGAAPTYIKDNFAMPAIYAIHRARKTLDKENSKATLCVTGGFRSASDIGKALAMGADAVALATFSLVGIGCQRYRTCHTGNCPVGITTQDPNLRSRFDIDKSVERFVKLYTVSKEELATLARVNGRSNVHNLDLTDIFTISNEVAENTDIEHA